MEYRSLKVSSITVQYKLTSAESSVSVRCNGGSGLSSAGTTKTCSSVKDINDTAQSQDNYT